MTIRQLLALIGMMFVLTACNQGVSYQAPVSAFDMLSVNALNVQPNPAVMYVYQQIQLVATGGTQPYYFTVLQGSCNVGYNSGVVTASSAVGTCVVQVRDSANTTVINVVTMAAIGTPI